MIQVCEYARLTCSKDAISSLEQGIVSKATFDWLIGLQQSWRASLPLLHIENHLVLKLDSYVGILRSPQGEVIEVLPKIHSGVPNAAESEYSRRLLQEMLSLALHLKPRQADPAYLKGRIRPLHEWIYSQFLHELACLIEQGLRRDYREVEEEASFIRGRLNLNHQSRQTPDRATLFQIRHQEFSLQRPENRFIKTALNQVRVGTRDSENWRLANLFSHQLTEIDAYPAGQLPREQWHNTKLMRAYEAIQPWCQLILTHLNPDFQSGSLKGISLLFPMEKLFENAVGIWLRRSLEPDVRLRTQARSQYLLLHQPIGSIKAEPLFQLRPDLILETSHTQSVLDTKWKLLNQNLKQAGSAYGLSIEDLYQLYAYGQKYLSGRGNIMLIYPKHSGFKEPLNPFCFDEQLQLWVVPFDLENKQLVSGLWREHFRGLFIDIKAA